MRVAIASTTVPNIDGGGRLIVRWTADAIRAAGHEVEEFYFPFPPGVRPTMAALVGLRAVPLATSCDRLIAIRWPAHLIRHENKATWFIHHYRELFDLWDTKYRTHPDTPETRAYRRAFRQFDNLGLGESQDVFTNSLIVRDRVKRYNEIDATPLFPPLGGDTSRFRNDGTGDFIFYPSRVTLIKRQLLAVEAMRHTTSGVRLVIAGKPENQGYADLLRERVREHGLEDKVTLELDWMEESLKVALMASSLAVAYLPSDEDSYGYPSLEASHSGKPIVTVADAGGALEFVRDGVEGFVAEPDPKALAAAFDQLYEDKSASERMGLASYDRRAELGISWENVVPRLLGVAP
ncbi:glycosyltransferase family 4 protein [Xylanimonas allomyrinae]|uniref:glycosyltransferase family 4 protein n=1 Tax=Xylanimonas allomyrinae TaxID=2509459 RepID=UPI0013A6443A|nr:glycosyltransferase family 4 protein [Xylanimonas allomyrinae]